MKLNKLIPLNDDLYAKLVFLVLVLMMVAVPFSRFLMSVSQISFGVLWLAHGKYKQKIEAFFHNPAAIVITSLYFLHLLGLFWTTDLNYALKDIRIKLPIFILPFMFVGFPKINFAQFKKLIYFFVASVLFVSIYLTIDNSLTSEEIRIILHKEFISHIRYSLNLNLAIFFIIILRLEDTKRNWKDILALFILVWLLWFLLYLKAFTGVIVFFILIFTLLIYFALKSNRIYKKVIYSTAIFLGLFSISFYLVHFVNNYNHKENIDFSKLDKRTASGHLYFHSRKGITENGKYIYNYVCEKELRKSWNLRSHIDFDSLDLHGQKIRYTLIRYLTSKDLRKDKEGIEALSTEDIRNIEKGIANYHYTQGIGIESRLMKILFEYNSYLRTGDPSGHSVMQRVEFWKTSWSIIQKNFWCGVGTGDLNLTFNKEYDLLNSKLSKESRLRSHNQYLSIWIAFGLVGLLWFLFVLFYPPLKLSAFKNIFFTLFFVSFIVSMLTEDTIETQAGVTYYIFFTSLFLFLFKHPLKVRESNKSL